MKKTGLETWLYSSLGVVAVFASIVIFNALASRAKTRVDLTADHAYTLSAGTRAILKKLDTPVQIRFYCTRDDAHMPVQLKTYAQRVEDLLGEYRQASKGMVEVQKLDPAPDSDAEDSAKLDGVEGAPTQLEGEPIYLGLSVSMLDQKEAIPFLSPDRERLLEYDISRAISRVVTTDKPVIGVMSPLPVAGQQQNPMMMMRRQQQQSQPAWVFFDELKQDYTVKQVEMTADKIPDEVKVLVVIHPKGITDAAQYAIDQFVLRGGKLIAFLDPLAALDPTAAANPMGMSAPGGSTLDKILKSTGLAFDNTQVVADLDFMGRTQRGRQPAVLALTGKAVNHDDVITADADNIYFVFGGAFTGSPVAGLKETVLLHSSPNSQLIDPMSAQFGGEKTVQDFVPSNKEYALAVRLTGKLKTAFPDGKPKAATPPADNAKPDEKKPDDAADASLKESKGDVNIVLFGDSDFLQDGIAVQEMRDPFGGAGAARGPRGPPGGDEERVANAITRAHAAFPAWSGTPVAERAAILERLADSLEAQRDDLMALCVQEAGKTIPDAIGEVREAADFCRYYADRARGLMRPVELPGPTGEHNVLRLQGRGVWATIAPWNFPLAIFLGQTVAALVTGNTVVAKPAPQTPRIAAAAVALAHEAGVPADALILAPGGPEVGAALTADPRVAGVAFTGSTATAKKIARSLLDDDARPIVPLIAETGGINAMIVDSTALPEQVVADVVASAFRSAGQRCSALRLLLLQEEIADGVIAMLKGAMDTLVVGAPGDPATDVGPVIDQAAHDRLMSYRAQAQGRQLHTIAAPDGLFVPPTLIRLDRIEDLTQEWFGPLLHVGTWPAGQLAETIARVNAKGFGLTMGLHSRIARAAEVAEAQAQVGNLYINRSMIGAVVG